MFAFAPVSSFGGVSLRPAQATCSVRPVATVTMMSEIHEGPGKGFGGGEVSSRVPLSPPPTSAQLAPVSSGALPTLPR
jgi:hypothetical protein